MPCAVLLFSGSLDSQLAARILASQGIEIAPLFVRTPWGCGDHGPEAASQALGVSLHCESVREDFFDPLTAIARRHDKATRFCGDCHLYLARCARLRMEAIGADFVATGDVLGQKTANQKRRDFDRYAHHSGLGDRLVWPLSAWHLTETLPERCGWLDRSRLGAYCGRSRAALKQLARQLALPVDDRGNPGCALGQTGDFGQRVLVHIGCGGCRRAENFELLRVGDHQSIGDARVVVGRRQAENDEIERLWATGNAEFSWLIRPLDFAGPTALVDGPESPAALALAISSLLRYAKRPARSAYAVLVTDRLGRERRIEGVNA